MEFKKEITDEIVITDSTTFSINVILTHPPVDELKASIKSERWFEGIVLATSYYEVFANEKINEYLKSKGKNIESKRIEKMNLQHILVFLYSHDIINESDYSQMIELNNYRNYVVHRLINKIDTKKSKQLIEHGIDCWIRLREKKIG